MPILARKQIVAEKRRTRARIDELRPRSYWLKQAQTAFNAWVRARDAALPCISCGKFAKDDAHTGGGYDAGHFHSTGARPELRFDEANCHRQCKRCNQQLSGNLLQYRAGLVARLGQAELDRLEGPHEPRHLSADDLRAIRDDYRARAKAIRREADA